MFAALAIKYLSNNRLLINSKSVKQILFSPILPGNSLNIVSYTTKLLVTQVRCVKFNPNFAFQTNLFTFIFNLNPCLSSLFVSCPCVPLIIHSIQLTFSLLPFASPFYLLFLVPSSPPIIPCLSFLLILPSPSFSSSSFSPPLLCSFSSTYFLFLFYPFLCYFFLLIVRPQSVLLLYTSVFVPCLPLLDL